MGLKVTKPKTIYVDNKSVFLNAANPASTLNKKAIALAYHFVCKHQFGKVVNIKHVHSEDNYADILTKGLNSIQHRNLLNEFMTNCDECHKLRTNPTMPQWCICEPQIQGRTTDPIVLLHTENIL